MAWMSEINHPSLRAKNTIYPGIHSISMVHTTSFLLGGVWELVSFQDPFIPGMWPKLGEEPVNKPRLGHVQTDGLLKFFLSPPTWLVLVVTQIFCVKGNTIYNFLWYNMKQNLYMWLPAHLCVIVQWKGPSHDSFQLEITCGLVRHLIGSYNFHPNTKHPPSSSSKHFNHIIYGATQIFN